MITINKTLYILHDKTYIHCEHDSFVVKIGEEEKTRIPVTIVQQIIIFADVSVSSYMIKYCSEHGILVSYVSPFGGYYGGLRGTMVGNVLLRQKQYRLYDNKEEKLKLVKNIVLGKAHNQIKRLEKAYAKAEPSIMRQLVDAANAISNLLGSLKQAGSIESVRGLEGSASSIYFGAFDLMLRTKDEKMKFQKRSQRPPQNNCNALLSFVYTMMTITCTSAVECFGLDSYMGYLHELRPGRASLACDLVEEFRASFCDRLVISLINEKKITSKDFEKDNDSIKLKDESRKELLQIIEEEKEKKTYFPLYEKEVPNKIIPYLQAQLLSQYIRGDIDEYPPYMEDL